MTSSDRDETDKTREIVHRPRFYSNVDAATLNYFKHVEQLVDEEKLTFAPETEEVDGNSLKDLFIGNVYKEIEGKELLLVCDHETSRVLEKILAKSDDFQLRVFLDRLSGRYVTLSRDRFASHVIQTLLSHATDVIDRELSSGTDLNPSEFRNDVAERGILLSMQQLVLIFAEQFMLCTEEEGSSSLIDLIFDPYASHVIRALIATLSGIKDSSLSRSKSSIEFDREHFMTTREDSHLDSVLTKRIPLLFSQTKLKLLHLLFDGLETTVFRRMMYHSSANPILQVR